MISLIIPCYNEANTIDIYMSAMKKIEDIMSERFNEKIEYIFVDDGSKDNTLKKIKNYDVKYISFSRNFGKEAGLYAGMQAAKGDYVAVMDVDLQDPPELLVQMYEILQSDDYDCVATKRGDRAGEPPVRSFFAKCFYTLINSISQTEIIDGARDYRLMKRKMVDAILELNEYNRFSKGLFGWVGFNTKWLEFENRERSAGKTKWSFWKLVMYSLDGIMAFSVVPLAIAGVIGIILCLLAIIFACVIVVKTLVYGDPVAGYPSLVCIILLLSGIQLFAIGVISQYISKIYLECKKRPIYIVKDSNI